MPMHVVPAAANGAKPIEPPANTAAVRAAGAAFTAAAAAYELQGSACLGDNHQRAPAASPRRGYEHNFALL